MRTVDIPQRVKDYFESGRKKIVKVIPNDNYSLTVHFNNDEIKVYDMSESLFGVFKILEDKEKFKEVFIDEYGNIAWDIDKEVDSSDHWDNRIDLCKDSIYINSVSIESISQ